MKPDIVSQICVYCDYPLWREWIAKYRHKFNKIILYPSRHHGLLDLEEFWKRVFPETWVDPVAIDYGKEDWRQAETIPCLKHVESDWVWFQEADFFVRDWDKLFAEIEEKSKDYDMMGLWHDSQFPYIHPCFNLIKKELLDRTNKDFSAHPETIGSDHFAMITRDVERLGAKIYKFEKSPEHYHLGGLTYVYQNWGFSRVIGVTDVEAFKQYNKDLREASVEQSPEFLKLSEEIEEYLK